MNLEEELVQLLKEKGYTFSSAESCTGGMLMGTIINVSGASSVVNEGFITYANEAKMKYLGVKKETLDKYTAVSEQTAYEMAYGLIAQTGAQVTASTTGLAGPDGGTEETPVGTVFVGCSVLGKVYVKRLQLHGDRLSIRTQAVRHALEFIIECVKFL